MIRLLIYFITLLCAVWVGVVAHHNPGTILLSMNNWTIETSIWFAGTILLLLFLLLYLILRVITRLLHTTTHLKQWFITRKKQRAHIQTKLGLYDFVAGNWAAAEKKLLRGAKYSDMPPINYLAAAFMAQRQQAFARRDQHLLAAQQVIKDHPMTVGLVQAQLQIGNKQWEEAAATLQQLHHLHPKNGFINQLLVQTYLELKDWHGLKNLLPTLRSLHIFSPATLAHYELQTYYELLKQGRADDTITVKWHALPHHLQKAPKLVALYTEFLLATNKAEEAENILKMVLRKNLDPYLLELYTKLPTTNPIKKLARAEKWLAAHPENPNLLLALGRICHHQKLWGKARFYLEKSARFQATPEIYLELGQILEAQNEVRGALRAYNSGLQLASKRAQLP